VTVGLLLVVRRRIQGSAGCRLMARQMVRLRSEFFNSTHSVTRDKFGQARGWLGLDRWGKTGVPYTCAVGPITAIGGKRLSVFLLSPRYLQL